MPRPASTCVVTHMAGAYGIPVGRRQWTPPGGVTSRRGGGRRSGGLVPPGRLRCGPRAAQPAPAAPDQPAAARSAWIMATTSGTAAATSGVSSSGRGRTSPTWTAYTATFGSAPEQAGVRDEVGHPHAVDVVGAQWGDAGLVGVEAEDLAGLGALVGGVDASTATTVRESGSGRSGPSRRSRRPRRRGRGRTRPGRGGRRRRRWGRRAPASGRGRPPREAGALRPRRRRRRPSACCRRR